jgi:hypothetical protein
MPYPFARLFSWRPAPQLRRWTTGEVARYLPLRLHA